jgi:hypothetical protein
MARALALAIGLVLALAAAHPAQAAAKPASVADRIEELQQELDSVGADVEDLQEPVEEFELFEECMYLIGVTEYGRSAGPAGFRFGPGKPARRPALALDIRGFGSPAFSFLAFPAEEPPSIECNEDAGEEDSDD